MDSTTQPQSSFIPKKPMMSGSISRSGGLFPFIANIIFVLTLIASIAVFAYSKYLGNQISKMNDDLASARQALEPDLIDQLAASDKRIIAANSLIEKHIDLSNFFGVLQSITLQELRFNSFAYTPSEQGSVLTVTMKGQARTYETVALQAKIFNENDNFVNPQFSNLDLDDSGNIVFTFTTKLDPKVVSYVATLGEQNTSAGAATGSGSSTPIKTN